jgi:hypothetical protein
MNPIWYSKAPSRSNRSQLDAIVVTVILSKVSIRTATRDILQHTLIFRLSHVDVPYLRYVDSLSKGPCRIPFRFLDQAASSITLVALVALLVLPFRASAPATSPLTPPSAPPSASLTLSRRRSHKGKVHVNRLLQHLAIMRTVNRSACLFEGSVFNQSVALASLALLRRK